MPLTLVTAPATEPITTTEAKLHAKVDLAADDALIQRASGGLDLGRFLLIQGDSVEELLERQETLQDALEQLSAEGALARAVALDPDLLVLEAPFDGLTQATAVELLGLANAREDGTERTVLITVQDLAAALRPLVTRVVRVAEGLAVNDTI